MGDLTTGDGLPSRAFDCFICTQTLQLIYDVRAAVRGTYDVLAPGGVLLCTVPALSQTSRVDRERWGEWWRFTSASVRRLLGRRVRGRERQRRGAWQRSRRRIVAVRAGCRGARPCGPRARRRRVRGRHHRARGARGMSAAPRIDVWVCARPHAPHLDAVLAALTAAGAEPRVAVSPAGQGLASARNEALAACEGEILALVDDDVEVSPGWLDALRAAWSSAGAAELGCVGGPLAAVFSGERPAWLGDALLPALGVDPGPPADGAAGVPVPVDAEKRTFHSGNIAFRVDRTARRGRILAGARKAGAPGLVRRGAPRSARAGTRRVARRLASRGARRASHLARRRAPARLRATSCATRCSLGCGRAADAARDGDPRRGHGDGGRGGRGHEARRREAGRAGLSRGAQRRGAGRAFARASQPPANGLAHPVHVLRAAGSAGAPQGSGAALGAPCPAPGS